MLIRIKPFICQSQGATPFETPVSQMAGGKCIITTCPLRVPITIDLPSEVDFVIVLTAIEGGSLDMFLYAFLSMIHPLLT
jgi:hypothetical protein